MDAMLQRILGADIDLISLPARTLGKVRVDRSSIEQVIMNLVVNARDAMPHGGKLTMETADVVLDEESAKQALGLAAGPYVMLAVTRPGGAKRRRGAHPRRTVPWRHPPAPQRRRDAAAERAGARQSPSSLAAGHEGPVDVGLHRRQHRQARGPRVEGRLPAEADHSAVTHHEGALGPRWAGRRRLDARTGVKSRFAPP